MGHTDSGAKRLGIHTILLWALLGGGAHRACELGVGTGSGEAHRVASNGCEAHIESANLAAVGGEEEGKEEQELTQNLETLT